MLEVYIDGDFVTVGQDAAVMGFHSITLERITSANKFQADGRNQVRPDETFRLKASNLTYEWVTDGRVTFVVTDANGNVVFSENAGVQFVNKDAWVDLTLGIPGSYTVTVATHSNALPFGGEHDATLTFAVVATAPDEPDPSPSGGVERVFDSFIGVFDNFTTIALVTVGGLVLFQGLGLAKTVAKRGK